MNRKREAFDPGNDIDTKSKSISKRLRSPSSTSGQTNLQRKEEIPQLISDQLTKTNHDSLSTLDNQMIKIVPQTPSKTGPGRKRRSRVSNDDSSSTKSDETTATSPKANISMNQTRKKSELSCVVCYGLAHGYNFDAISCESCKAFFRRNALYNADRLKCRRNGSCEITLETRRRCKSCRLKKCFAVGMRKEWILTEEEKLNKKLRIEENRKLRLATIFDPSTSNNLPVETTLNDSTKDLEMENDEVFDQKSVEIFKSSLPKSTQEVIENVVLAFHDGFRLEPIGYGWSYALAKKVTGICQMLHVKNTTALRLISFYRRLHMFDALDELEKVCLVKTNLPCIFFFHSSLDYDSINDIYYEGNSTQDTRVCGSDIRDAYGDDLYRRCTSIMRSLKSIVQLDKNIIHLALVIMLFSKSLSNIINNSDKSSNNGKDVFHAQNYYTEHLWFHMEKSFGTKKSIRTFTTLISRSLLIQKLLCDINQNIVETFDSSEGSSVIRTFVDFS